MIENLMATQKVDRLSAFFDVFELSASLDPALTADSHARLLVIGPLGGPAEKIVLRLRGETHPAPSILVTAAVDFGGVHNPLMNALPDQVSVETNDAPALRKADIGVALAKRVHQFGNVVHQMPAARQEQRHNPDPLISFQNEFLDA